MKSRHIYPFIAFTLLALSIFMLLSDRWSTVDDFDALLLKHPERVDAIEIAGPMDTLVMLKEDSVWIFPGGEVLHTEAVGNLLAAAGRIRVISVFKAGETDLSASTRISFRKKNREILSIRVMAPGTDVMVTSGDMERVFSVELPGYDQATLQKIFSNNPDHYREHLLVSYLPREIRRIDIHPFSGEPFRVLQDTAGNVRALDLSSGKPLEGISDHRLRMLLSYFNIIRYDRVLPGDRVPGYAGDPDPDAMVFVEGDDGGRHSFSIWQWQHEGEKAPDLFEALVIYNNEPRVLVINYAYLDLLLRSKRVYQENK